MDLETLLIEYEAAQAQAQQQQQVYQRYELAVQVAQNALVDAMIDAGLTSYGPITSTLDWSTGAPRRVWSTKKETLL